jgi:hypothetical protein
MRKKMGNLYFTIFYPGLNPQSTVGESERRNMPAIYIERKGEFVSICGSRYGGEHPAAVFYSVDELMELRDCLDEAIEVFQDAKAKKE